MYWQYFDFVRKRLTKNFDFLEKYEERNYGGSVNRTSELCNVLLTACVFLMFTLACFYFFTVIYHVELIMLLCFGGTIIITALICFMFAIRPYITVTRPTLKWVLLMIFILAFLGGLGYGIYWLSDTYNIVKKTESESNSMNIECPYKDLTEEEQQDMRRRIELLSDIRKMVSDKKEDDLLKLLR